jgi:hypothetical protein
MTRILTILLGLTALLPWVSCGGTAGAAREYAGLRDGEKRGEELVAALEDFELRHPEHFYSKVDLGTYYLALGEEGRAGDYLRRAEALAERARGEGELKKFRDGGGEQGGNYLSILYGALGSIYLSRGEGNRALEYAERAIEQAGERAGTYRLLKAQILIKRGDYEGALEIFDGVLSPAMAGAPTEAGAEAAGTSEDLLAYLYLLARAERPADAAALLDRYFETGAFFPGLGTFAALVYRAAGDRERAAYAEYLEGEYGAGYAGGGSGEGGNPPAPEAVPAGGDFFAGEYLALKEEIDRGSLSEARFRRYLELEPYFRLFPSYYWNLWLGARLVYPERREEFVPALQKIIALDRDGPYAPEAWRALGSLLGF